MGSVNQAIYDPSDLKRKNRRYETTVGGDIYRTISLLHDRGSDALIGRAVRVFEVVPVEQNGHERDEERAVLKDIWLDVECDTERLIYNKILADIKDAAK